MKAPSRLCHKCNRPWNPWILGRHYSCSPSWWVSCIRNVKSVESTGGGIMSLRGVRGEPGRAPQSSHRARTSDDKAGVPARQHQSVESTGGATRAASCRTTVAKDRGWSRKALKPESRLNGAAVIARPVANPARRSIEQIYTEGL